MSSEISRTNYKESNRTYLGALSPLITVLFASAILLTGIIFAVFGHKFGYHQGYEASEDKYISEGANQIGSSEEFQKLQNNIDTVTSQLDAVKKERDISLNNLGQLRSEMQKLEVKNLQLTQVNDVYANNLRKRGGLPLQIIGAKMAPLPENAFEYRFDVALLSKDGKEKSLRPKLTLLDEENLVEVPLEPSKYSINGIARIRGRFVMPDGFTPKQVKLNLSANGQNIEQIYNWQLASPVDKMPLSLSQVPELDQKPITD